MSSPAKIDATGLIAVQLSPDGKRLHLKLRDEAGQAVSLTVPSSCINAMLAAIPRRVEKDVVHTLDAWAIDLAENGLDLVLTLRTSEGRAVSFMAKPSQVQGMATIATCGGSQNVAPKAVH